MNNIVIVLIVFAFLLVLSLCIFFIYQYIILLNSLKKISNIVKAIRYGNLSKRINIKPRKGLFELITTINNTIEALEDRENIIKMYQNELREQNQYLKEVFDSLNDGIIIVSDDMTILHVNPSALGWIGKSEKDVEHKKICDFVNCNNCTDGFKSCNLLGDELFPKEISIANFLSQEEKFFSVSTSSIVDAKNVKNIVLTLRDITQFKAMNELREDFIATLTHDLKVPLLAHSNTLKFFLKRAFGEINDKQAEAINTMIDSNDEVLGMVNSLLDTYKSDAGKFEIKKTKNDIQAIIQECVKEVSSLLEKKNHNLVFVEKTDIPEIYLDKNEIKRVIRNLLNNSFDYTPKGGQICINVYMNSPYVQIDISDTGRGISQSDIEQIFDRFFSKAKKLRKVGTGLGLYLSKKIIEQHGGLISVKSEINKGSTFTISLPLNEI